MPSLKTWGLRQPNDEATRMLEWIQANEAALWWTAIFSIVACAAGMVAAPWWAIRLPADYFLQQEPGKRSAASPSQEHWVRFLMRNLLGSLLILAGLAMLVLPGQGILSILAGMMIMDFPAKHRLARAILLRPSVLRSLNWIRRKAGKPALKVDP